MSLALSKLEKVRERAGKMIARCPVCARRGEDDKCEHLSIRDDGAYHCIRECDTKEIFELAGDSKPARNGHSPIHLTKPATSKARRIDKIPDQVFEGTAKASFVCSYQYEDEQGKPRFAVARYAFPPGSDKAKTFRQYPIVEGGYLTGEGCMKGIRLVPYRLPLIGGAETVIVVEGERDAETLEALGYVATCNPGGAEKWREEWSHHFEGKNIVVFPDNDDPGRRHAEQVEAALRPVAKSIKRVVVPSPHKDITEYLESGSDNDTDTEARAKVDALLSVPDPLDALLDARRLNLANPPAKPVPVLLITEKPICTAGNLTVIQAIAKAGKTSFEAACIASLMNPTGDCLGVTGQNPDGLAVIHFDTEQSEYDHFEIIRQSLARAGRPDLPEWLRSYHLADVPTKDRRKALAREMKRAAIDGKLRAVFVDGGADLCVDPNDSAEAFGLVEEWHRLAITYQCPIVIILHENPGTLTAKTRGHLGSQLERKAETNLRLDKAPDGVTTVFTERSRHCHIPKESGPRFQWDDIAGMHLSCGTSQQQRRDSKAQQHHETAVGIFGDDPAKSMTWAELIAALEPLAGTKKNAENRINAMKKYNVVRYEFGKYRLCNL